MVAATKVQPYMTCLWGNPWRLWQLLKKAGLGGRDIRSCPHRSGLKRPHQRPRRPAHTLRSNSK